MELGFYVIIETESLNSSFSNVILQCLKNREKNIMNNKVLLSAIFLDPRYNNINIIILI